MTEHCRIKNPPEKTFFGVQTVFCTLKVMCCKKYKPVAGAVGLIQGLVFRHVQQTKENVELHLPPSLQHLPSPYQPSLQSGINKYNEVNTSNRFKCVLLMYHLK
jgi:hypothetical protein